MLEVHISKHSLFRLKITVGCLVSTYPSIHFSLDEDTLKITVGCLVSTYPSIHKNSQDHGRLSEVLWCVVCCVLCGCMRVLCCVMSCVLCCWVCCVVVVLCGVWVFFLSLSFSLSLFLSILFFLFLALSLSFLFFPSSVLSSSFSSLFPSRQQTLCKALINKRDVQL